MAVYYGMRGRPFSPDTGDGIGEDKCMDGNSSNFSAIYWLLYSPFATSHGFP